MPPRFRPRLPSLLLAASLAALTCDDARRGGPLAEQVAQAFCAHRFACCSPFEMSLLSTDRYKSEADCVEFATLAARQQLGTVQGAIAQGHITVDEARAEACFRAYREQACAVGTSVSMGFFPPQQQPISPLPDAAAMLAACPGLLVGHVSDNQACNVSYECVSGSRCLSGTSAVPGQIPGSGGAAGTIVATPGICARYQQGGERCNQSTDCDPAQFSCRLPDFTCGAKPQEGEICLADVDPLTGYPRNTCDESRKLFCDLFFTGTCRHYPRENEICNQTSLPQCDPDPALALSCNQFTNTCRRPGKENDPCGAMAIPPCRSDLACHPKQSDGIGVCGDVPALGEPCSDRCVSPAVCSGGTCTAPGRVPVGSPCTTSAECTTLSCTGVLGGRLVCGVDPYLAPQCIGAGVTAGRVSGAGGIGGTVGTAGSIGTGARGMPPTGTGGVGGGTGPAVGCRISFLPPNDPVIADFETEMGGPAIIPIGGTFTYGMPSPIATVTGGAWHVTLDAPGLDANAQYLGAGIYFNGDASGLACIDATAHTGVQFDISGSVSGEGCTAQYATNDSIHTESMYDPKGSGPPGAYSPQAPLTVSTSPTTVMMPFNGAGAPVGGNPAVGVDKARLTGVLWQFTVAPGTSNRCLVDVTIDNVRFF